MDEEKSFDEEISERDIEQKEQTVTTPEIVKVNGNKGKPKSEAWKQAQSQRMKDAHARRKANKTI